MAAPPLYRDFDYQMKLIIVGNSYAGKTCLLKSFMSGVFDPASECTIGVDYQVTQRELLGHKVSLQVWDTGGQERFRTITKGYFRGADGVVIVFDVCSQESFDSVPEWLDQVKAMGPSQVSLLLVGNKVDLIQQRVISYHTAQSFAEANGIPYFETSALNPNTVVSAFVAVSTTALKNKIESQQHPEGIIRLKRDAVSSRNTSGSPILMDQSGVLAPATVRRPAAAASSSAPASSGGCC